MEGALPEPKGNRDWRCSIPLEHDFDSSRREAQREDEQESNNLTPHHDHWKEGERDRGGEQAPFPLQNQHGLNERRTENKIAAGREPGEPLQRAPSEWRADLNGQEINFGNRCNSKWRTRWGLEDKDREVHGPRDGHDKEVVDGGYHQRYATTPSSCRDYDRYKIRRV